MSDSKRFTRRQLFGGFLQSGSDLSVPRQSSTETTAHGAASMGRPRASRTFPVIRPPGAVDEASFMSRCTKCNECVDICPHDAITHAPLRFRAAAGTPMIDPAKSPCRMCDDLPCITACPEQALLPIDVWPIATARLLDYNCLAHQGSFCTVCEEQCPVPEAITLSQGRPTIHAAACTGCGICHFACPAPTNAIAVMPLALDPGSSPRRP
ncbi:MAG: ferredoxin-type protein NapG [Planctomycetota bacterium]|jgi:ferredoxin-type protein NapG